MATNELPKEPLSVRIMNFWNSLSPAFRYSIFFVTSALLTMIQQIVGGAEWNGAVVTFLGALISQITAMQAISKVSTEHVEEAKLTEPTLGINMDSPIPDSSSITPIN